MPPRVTIMPNYAELCYYADYAAPMQLCRFIMLASSGMPKLCYATNARGAPVFQVEMDAVAPCLGGLCAPWHAHAARTGRAVVLLGGGVCLSGLVLSAPSFRPQLIPPPQTSVLTDSCVSLSLFRCLEACDTGEGRR